MNDRLKAANDGEYNNLLVVILAIAAIYLLVRGWSKSKQQLYSEQAGGDIATQQAIQLQQSMNRWGSEWTRGIDGTDVETIMMVGRQITNYASVSQAYRSLYNRDLTADLTSELNQEQLTQFFAVVNAVKSTPVTSTGTSGGAAATNSSLVGKSVVATQTANIRADKPPYAVESGFFGGNIQVSKGDYLGTYVAEMLIPDLPNPGNRNVFVRYKELGIFNVAEYHWIVKSAVKIG